MSKESSPTRLRNAHAALGEVHLARSLFAVRGDNVSAAAVVTDVAFSPDSRYVAASGVFENIIWVWSVASGELVVSISAGIGKDGTARISPRISFSDNGDSLWAFCDGIISRICTKKWQVTQSRSLSYKGYPRELFAMTAGSAVLAVYWDDDVLILRDGKGRLAALERPEIRCVVNSLRFHPREEILAAVGPSLLLWDVKKRKLVAQMVLPNGKAATDIAFGKDGKSFYLALEEGGIAQVHNTGKGLRVHPNLVLPSNREMGTFIDIHPKFPICATAGEQDRMISLVDVRTGAVLQTVAGFQLSHYELNPFHWLRARFSQDGKWMVVNAGTVTGRGAVTLYSVTQSQ
jgi:WD40 repeat protein